MHFGDDVITNPLGQYSTNDKDMSDDQIRRKFKAFIRSFQINQRYIYRDQLSNNYSMNQFFIEVRIEDLSAFDEKLVTKLQDDPATTIPMFEQAAKDAVSILQIDIKSPFLGMLSPSPYETYPATTSPN
jgi:DNA replicative helicase MCM subunit Mcm2 (Cdc46/Mcm family)